MFLLPGNGPRSRSRTDRPARAATIAAHEPAGPPPTTITSKSTGRLPATSDSATGGRSEEGDELVEGRVGVGGDGEVGQLHHRAVPVDVDADDVRRGAEAAGVLHRPADP